MPKEVKKIEKQKAPSIELGEGPFAFYLWNTGL